MKKLIKLLFTIILLPSCVEEVDLLYPVEKPQLVVNSIITPDSTVKVSLYKTIEVQSNEDRTVSEALINLYENNASIGKLEEISNGVYEINYKPKQHCSYKIEISTPEWGRTHSEAYLPDTVVVSDAKYKPFQWYDEQEMTDMATCSFIIHDPAEIENYYELQIWSQYYGEIYNPVSDTRDTFLNYSSIYNLIANNEVIENEGLKDKNPTSFFFSDQLFNGTDYTFIFECAFSVPYGYDIDENGNTTEMEYYPEDAGQLMVQVRSISKEYYEFRRSWTQHYFNQRMQELRDISEIVQYMFTAEPIRMSSNIENGLGVFVGYSGQTIELEFTAP